MFHLMFGPKGPGLQICHVFLLLNVCSNCIANSRHCQSKRLSNSGFQKTSMHKKQDDTRTVLNITQHALRLLEWKSVVFFYDAYYSAMLDDLLSSNWRASVLPQIVSVMKLPRTHDVKDVSALLQEVYTKNHPHLNFVLIANHTTAYEFLNFVGQHDLQSRRTTDYRHYSYWLVPCQGVCTPSAMIPSSIQLLENVAFVSYSSKMITKIHALSRCPTGTQFTVVPRLYNVTQVEIGDSLFPNRKYGFNNRTLLVETKLSAGLMNTDDGYTGYLREILDAMSNKLNFSFEIGQPPDGRWGIKLANGSWDGMIGQLVTREIDMAVATITIHQDREKVMDFLLPPTFTEVYDVIYRLHDLEDEGWKIYFKPFSMPVFGLVTCTYAIFVGLMTAVSLWEDKSVKSDLLAMRIDRVVNISFYIFASVFTRSVWYPSRTWSMTFLLFSWGIFSVIMAAVYCGKLVALFAATSEIPPFRNLEELIEQTDYKFGIESGHVTELIFKSAKSGKLKNAWDRIVEMNKTDSDVLHRELIVHTEKMLSEKYAYVTSRRFAQEQLNKHCTVRLLGEAVMWQQYGIGVPQDYPAKKDFERVLSVMQDTGLMDTWYDRWRVKHDNKCQADHTVQGLDLQDLQTAFYIVCGGLAVSAIVLVAEKLVYSPFMKHRTFKFC